VTLVLCALLCLPAALRAQEVETLRLTATQDILQANGYSTAFILAEARDRSGNLVPDGTEVRFTTTLGTIDQVAMTVAGTARVTLRSSPTPGTASILATSGRAQREIRVNFLAEGQAAPQRLRVVVCEGDYLAFSADYGVVVIDGNARVTLGDLKLRADRAQVDIQRNEVRLESRIGEDTVVLTDGKTTLHANRAAYDWQVRSGVMSGGPDATGQTPVSFSGPTLAKIGQAAPGEADRYAFVDLDETGVWVVSKRIAIFPGLRIQFKRAEFRPAGKKFLTLPYHSLPLTTGYSEENILSVGSEGLSLDLPLYLSLNDNSASTLRFGYNQREGSLGAIRKGFGLDLRYRTFGYDQDGEVINLSRITSSDWGAWWRHTDRSSGPWQTNGFLEFPDHRDLFASGNLSFQGKAFTSLLSLSASAPEGYPFTTGTELSLQTMPRKIGKSGVLWSLISGSGYATGRKVGEPFSQSLQGRLSLPTLNLSSKARSTMALTVGRNLLGSNKGGIASFIFSVSQQVARTTSVTANYTYDDRPGFGSVGRHRVGGMFSMARGSKWLLSTTGNYALDGGSASVYGQFTYHLTPTLRIDLRNTYFRSRNIPFSDTEVALAKTVLGRDLILFWSRQRHRLQIEFAAATF
jgi:hypothetical protein